MEYECVVTYTRLQTNTVMSGHSVTKYNAYTVVVFKEYSRIPS